MVVAVTVAMTEASVRLNAALIRSELSLLNLPDDCDGDGDDECNTAITSN
jgi:hypothetical protein